MTLEPGQNGESPSEACATRLCSQTFSVGLNPKTSMALT